MLRALFVLAILGPGLVAALKKRYAALLLYIWFALFRPQDFLWFDITALRLSLVLSLLVVVPWAWLATKRTSQAELDVVAGEALPNFSHPLSIGAVLFFATALAAQSNAVKPDIGWGWLDYLWRVLLVTMVMVTMVSTQMRFIIVVAVAAASLGFYSAKAGVYSLLGGGVRFADGLGGAFADNNGYALAVIMILFLLVATAQNAPQRWVRVGFWATVPLSAFTIICTYSRAGFLALVVATFVFILLQRRRAVALAVVIPVVLVGMLLLPEGYTDRVKTIQTYEEDEDTSATGRLHFWQVAMNMVHEHPLGLGLFNYQAAYDDYDFSGGEYGKGRAVHSSHFQVLAENGYAGFALWIGMFGYAFFAAFRVRQRSTDARFAPDARRFYFTMANALIVSMTGFLVGGAFIALALNDLTWMTFGLVAALDRLSTRSLEQAATEPVRVDSSGQLVDPVLSDRLMINPAFRARGEIHANRVGTSLHAR